MRILSILFSVGLLIGIVGCSSIAVKSDYDQEVNFANLKTFDWIAQPQKPASDPILEGTLMEKRIQNAVNKGLTAKGYQQQTDGEPDFLLAYHIGVKDKLDVQDWGYGYGPRRFWRWGGVVQVREYQEGTLILDIIDSKSKQLIWRGWAIEEVVDLSSEKVEKKIDQAVKKIFEKFPPKTSYLTEQT